MPGKARPVDQPCGWLPAASVDGVVGVAVAGVRRADLGRAAEASGVLQLLPARDVRVAPVQADEGAGDLGGVVDHGHALGLGEASVADPGVEVVLPESTGSGGLAPQVDHLEPLARDEFLHRRQSRRGRR